jgi:hypothetical protein
LQCNLRNNWEKVMKILTHGDTRPFSLGWKHLLPVPIIHSVKLTDFEESAFGSSYKSTENSDTSHAWLLWKDASTLTASIAIATFCLLQ